jgi:hypothetical protein
MTWASRSTWSIAEAVAARPSRELGASGRQRGRGVEVRARSAAEPRRTPGELGPVGVAPHGAGADRAAAGSRSSRRRSGCGVKEDAGELGIAPASRLALSAMPCSRAATTSGDLMRAKMRGRRARGPRSGAAAGSRCTPARGAAAGASRSTWSSSEAPAGEDLAHDLVEAHVGELGTIARLLKARSAKSSAIVRGGADLGAGAVSQQLGWLTAGPLNS